MIRRPRLHPRLVDYLAFLYNRTTFLKRFYSEASEPFRERRRKIEHHEGEYAGAPNGYEDDEPPYLNEWMEDGDALDVLGQQCIALLSSSLYLYIQEWVAEVVQRAGKDQLTKLGVGFPSDTGYKTAFKDGWINGYRTYCAALGVDWNQAPADLSLLEQVVLVRNTTQHPSDIASIRATQTKKDLAKHPKSFFADEIELSMVDQNETGRFSFPVRLNITREKLFEAIDQVECFCDWLDTQHPFH